MCSGPAWAEPSNHHAEAVERLDPFLSDSYFELESLERWELSRIPLLGICCVKAARPFTLSSVN